MRLWPEYWVFVDFRPFPTLCDFPVLFSDFGETLTSFSFSKLCSACSWCWGSSARSGQRLRLPCLSSPGEGMKADEKSPWGATGKIPEWRQQCTSKLALLTSTDCSGSPNRIIQSRSQSDWIKEKEPNSLPPFAFWEFHLGGILHPSYLLHFNYCCPS